MVNISIGEYCVFYSDDNGEAHRNNGPAIIYNNESKSYWKHGKFHRLNGLSIEGLYGYKQWYYEGKFIDCNNQHDFERLIRLMLLW